MAERIVSIKLRADATGLTQGLNQASDAVTELGGKVKQSTMNQRQEWATVGTALTGVGVAITGIGLAALKTGIQYNTLQQVSRAALSTLLGGAQAANAQMDKLDEFARTSPFAKQVFIEAQQQLLGFGMEAERVVPTLDAIQNAVAATGGSNQDIAELVRIIAQLEGGVKLSAETFNQFGARGIDAAQLIGDAMGKTGAQIREEVTAGTLDADQAIRALTEGMATRFAGASANVKETFDGAMDRVKAAWRDFSSELARPLVDPNGGGALIDLLNWAADMMRAFEDLPGPVKTTVSAITGLTGVTALGLGALMLVLPKWYEFTDAMKTLTNVSAGTRAALGDIGSFLKGPWMIAILAAAVAYRTFSKATEYETATQAELANALNRTKDTHQALADSVSQGATSKWFYGDLKLELEGLPELMDKVRANGDGFKRWWWTTPTDKSLLEILGDAGRSLAETAATDLPKAQEQFKNLVDSYEMTSEQAKQAIKEMPEFREELIGVADGLGFAADESILLEIAMGRLGPVTGAAVAETAKASSELIGMSEAAESAWKEINSLVDSLNYFNDVGQTAERQNAKLQETLADIETHVQKAREGADGYSFSLDRNTAEGSANREMLADLAGQSQTTAAAIFEQELATLGADEATKNYRERLEEGRQKLIDVATQFGLNSAEAESFADVVYSLPTEHEFKAMADVSQAERELQAYIDRNTGREVWVNVKTTMDQSVSYGPGTGGLAHGGTVGYAGGGTIPGAANGMTLGIGGGVNRGTVFGQGTSKSDSVLVRLSKGEEVIQQPYAGMNRDLLKSINRGDFHQGMMSGMTAGQTSMDTINHIDITVVAAPGDSLDATANRVASKIAFKAGGGR